MAFGNPTKYWQMDSSKVFGVEWDRAVQDASQEYRNRMVSVRTFLDALIGKHDK